jgi:glycosyltransferase involved in cell wall biosynthesis
MKVLLVGYTVPGSGARGMGLGIGRYIYYLGKELVEMGHDVELVVRDDFKPKEKWIKTTYSPKFSWYPYPFFLKQQLKNKQADVFNSDYIVTGAPLAWLNKKPLVVAIHDAIPFSYNQNELSLKDKMFVRFYKYCLDVVKEKADAITVLSENARENIINNTNINEDKVFVVSAGYDPEFFYPTKKKSYDKIRIGYKGGLDGRKNVKLLVEVFRRMVEKRDDIELHVAGTGANLEKFRSMKIPNAKFYGFLPIDEENRFLNSLDIFVYPTLGEGFGLPPLEAMGCGVAVLASNTTSMPEVVGDSGILVEPTVAAFYKNLWNLVESRMMRRKVAARCLKRAKTMTWRRTAEDSLEIYERIT